MRERRNTIVNEYPIWRDRAVAFNIDVNIRPNYDASYNALITYLNAINIDSNTTSTIVRADFTAGFNNYALWREKTIEAIAQEAARRAQWSQVTGSGRPADNADVTGQIS